MSYLEQAAGSECERIELQKRFAPLHKSRKDIYHTSYMQRWGLWGVCGQAYIIGRDVSMILVHGKRVKEAWRVETISTLAKKKDSRDKTAYLEEEGASGHSKNLTCK